MCEILLGHTFDAFDPPVDVCNVCAESPGENIAVDGLPLENSATIMVRKSILQ